MEGQKSERKILELNAFYRHTRLEGFLGPYLQVI